MKEIDLTKYKKSNIKIHRKLVHDNLRIHEVHILTDADSDG